jgi:hypothetical protein
MTTLYGMGTRENRFKAYGWIIIAAPHRFKMHSVRPNAVFVTVLFVFQGAFAIKNISAEINDPHIVYDTFSLSAIPIAHLGS